MLALYRRGASDEVELRRRLEHRFSASDGEVRWVDELGLVHPRRRTAAAAWRS